MFVFTPASHEPVYVRKNLGENDMSILAACFLPNSLDHEEDTVVWQKNAQLYFLDSHQELLTLESKSESSKALENLSASRNLPLTAFNRLLATERITNVEKTSVVHDYIKGTSKNLVEKVSCQKLLHLLYYTLIFIFITEPKIRYNQVTHGSLIFFITKSYTYSRNII